MVRIERARCTSDHEQGIVLHHRRRWWFIGLPDDAGPSRAKTLSGRLTPALAARLRREAENEALPPYVSSFIGYERPRTGAFACIASARDSMTFDLDAHDRGKPASDAEARLARMMVDTTLYPVPAGFISVFEALPRDERPVLAIRVSAYVFSRFELLTARYQPVFRPLAPWRNLSGNAVTDSGSDIIGWCDAGAWLRPG